MSVAGAPGLLHAILDATRAAVAFRRRVESDEALEARAHAAVGGGDRFREALADARRVNVIAECKRRSPLRGVLRRDYDPAAIAVTYQAAGAAAVSVLTEPTFFDGTLAHLSAVRAAVRVPVLRKDFILDRYQLLEAKACGADAVLLIVAALAQRELEALHAQARALQMGVMVEAHTADEVDRALDAGAEIIGVNNRNLQTMEVDPRVSESAAARIPRHVIAVSESGLRSAEDVARLRAFGYRGFLIGERLMTAAEPAATLRTLLEGASATVHPDPRGTVSP